MDMLSLALFLALCVAPLIAVLALVGIHLVERTARRGFHISIGLPGREKQP